MIFKLALFACHGVRNITSSFCHPGRSRRRLIGSMLFAIALSLTACGDDSSTSVNDGDGGSEAAMTSSSRHSGPGPESSSSKKVSSSSSSTNIVSSSWSEAIGSSNSTQKPSSSSKTVIQSSSSVTLSATSVESNGSSAVSSSSVYVPFDHSKTLAEDWRVGENRYKQFTDPRNGRSYYYIKIIGKRSSGRKDSVTIMAENLNIGEMVLGKNDQNDDTKIERYCYNNDTTKCDEFGGLYQWAEMMQLPSRCNTESCSDLIQENHRGICPDGWRLMTYKDFYIAWHAETNEYGIEGVRSAYSFNGYNSTGLSLTGAGLRTAEGGFDRLRKTIFLAYPEEELYEGIVYVRSSYVSGLTDHAPSSGDIDKKTQGYSVRCVMVE